MRGPVGLTRPYGLALLAMTTNSFTLLFALKGARQDLSDSSIVEPDQADASSPVLSAKIFLFSPDPNQIYISPRPAPHKGRIAIVTDAGRDAMEAAASGALMARGRMALFRLR